MEKVHEGVCKITSMIRSLKLVMNWGKLAHGGGRALLDLNENIGGLPVVWPGPLHVSLNEPVAKGRIN